MYIMFGVQQISYNIIVPIIYFNVRRDKTTYIILLYYYYTDQTLRYAVFVSTTSEIDNRTRLLFVNVWRMCNNNVWFCSIVYGQQLSNSQTVCTGFLFFPTYLCEILRFKKNSDTTKKWMVFYSYLNFPIVAKNNTYSFFIKLFFLYLSTL